MFKTTSDIGPVEEWILNDDRSNTIKLNNNFIDFQGWGGCTKNLNTDIQLINNVGDDCEPPQNKQEDDGFHNCYFPDKPVVVVTKDEYESGLKYTMDFQIGDYVGCCGFQNGPTFTTSPSIYTEPDHRSFDDLEQANEIERYFTRSGSDRRRAKFFVKYIPITLPSAQDLSPFSTITCN